MKKGLLFIVTVFIATSMSAQFYAGLGLGYGMGAGKTDLGTEMSGSKATVLYGSFGQGLNITPKLGYMFNENMGFELGVDYFMGSAQTLYEDETELMEGKSSGLILAPQFVLKTESGIYSRFGIFLPVAGKTIITDTDSDYNGDGTNVQYDMEMEAQGSFSLGFIGALGYGFALSDKMTFFAEMQYSAMSMKSGTSEITKMEVGGVNALPNMTTSQIETEYVEEIDYSVVQDPNSPSQARRDTSPFSAFGVNVGITFSF